MKKSLFCAVWLAVSCWAQGAVLLNDAFNYPNGPLVNGSGGSWNTHSGTTGQVEIVDGRIRLTQTESEDINAVLAPPAASVLYASFKVNFTNLPGGAAGYFAHFNTGTHRGRLFALTNNAATGFFRVGVAGSGSSPNAVIPMDLSRQVDYTLVLRHVASNSVTTLWLNPTGETDASVTDTNPASSASITALAFRQSSGIGSLWVDDVQVGTSFADVVANTPPVITMPPQNQTVMEGAEVAFNVEANGSGPLQYQWWFNGAILPSATNARHLLTEASRNDAGTYQAVVSNYFGAATSPPAILTVTLPAAGALSVLNYNTHGAAVTDWSTNAAQVRAIGRQVAYLRPDVVTFQEIPYTNTHEMTNFVKAFLPGYHLATNSGTDGFIRSVIVSRFPITRSQKWLDGANLDLFGYTNSNFTRDLFEAQLEVPGFETPVHIFTTHLKAGNSSSDDAAKRAAEASAISNFFFTSFLPTQAGRPYLLTGDLNEDIARPAVGSRQPIQRLVNAATGLHLTTPVNPGTGSELTFSIQAAGLTKRYDYILPGGLLASNIVSSEVFRSDQLYPPPPDVLTNDTREASDHLPVRMVFANPFNSPYRIGSFTRTDQMVTLIWPASSNRHYHVEMSANLTNWTTLAANLTAASNNLTFSTNINAGWKFFRILRDP